jgi:hypothetical protein
MTDEKTYQYLVLSGVLDQIQAWGEALLAKAFIANAFYANNFAEQLRTLGAGVDLPQFGRVEELADDDRQKLSAAMAELSRIGALKAVCHRSETVTHLRPTPRALCLAVQAVRLHESIEPNLDALEAALKTARWATPAHLEAITTLREPE